MMWDKRRRNRRPASSPIVEPLEGRLLLSLYQGPTRSRPVYSNGAYYKVTLSGPGYETINQVGAGHHQQFAINLYGTTSASTLSISLMLPARGYSQAHPALQVASINVASGQLGGVEALDAADLDGPITPISGSVSTLQFNAIGPAAQIQVGALGSLDTSGAITLGPTGYIHVGSLAGPDAIGGLTIDGGQFTVDGDLTGPFDAGAVIIEQGGRFQVGHDIAGPVSLGGLGMDSGQFLVGHSITAGDFVVGGLVLQDGSLMSVGQDVDASGTDGVALDDTGDLTIGSKSGLAIGNNLAGLTVGQSLTLDGGKLVVGNDLTGPVSVGSNLAVSDGGQLAVGRDLTGGLTVQGDLTLDSGGGIAVGRAMDGLTVNGDLTFTPSAGLIAVGGDLTNLVVNGIFQGKAGGLGAIDLMVGTNLTNFTVNGGGNGLGSIRGANVDVGKTIMGLNAAHGIFNSLITAGVNIENSSVGPDGIDGVFDSQILAGSEILNMTISGNVRSDYVTNPSPTGYRTRIVAGEDRAGTFYANGIIDQFQITGQLIDSVVAASVAPNGDSGTLPQTGYGATTPTVNSSTPAGDDGYSTYDAPAGTTTIGANTYPNYTELTYNNGALVGVAYNGAEDPVIDDTILPGGAINPSFAGTNGTPSEATVLGGVVTTAHGNNPEAYDFAGLFAANTAGVFVGGTPPQSSSSS